MNEQCRRGAADDNQRARDGQRGRVPSSSAVALFAGLIVFLYLIRAILLPFVLSGIVAFICTPLVDLLRLRLRMPRWLAALGVFFAVVSVAAVVGWLGVPPLLNQVTRVAGDLGGAVEGFASKFMGQGSITLLGTTVDAATLGQYTVESLRGWFTQESRVITVAAIGISWVFGSILTIVLFGYFLLDGPRIRAGLFWLVPPRHRPFAARAWRELGPVLRRYFVGVALVVAYASAAAYVGLGVFLGLHHAVVLALITGLLEVIPLVGPAAAAIIAGLVAVQEAKSTAGIIAYVIYAVALRISIDQFFGPVVLGRAARIPPVLVIFCFLAGGLLFGVVGVMLAVPAALSIRIVLIVLYDEPAPDRAPPHEDT